MFQQMNSSWNSLRQVCTRRIFRSSLTSQWMAKDYTTTWRSTLAAKNAINLTTLKSAAVTGKDCSIGALASNAQNATITDVSVVVVYLGTSISVDSRSCPKHKTNQYLLKDPSPLFTQRWRAGVQYWWPGLIISTATITGAEESGRCIYPK